MIGLLRAAIRALELVLGGQESAARQAADDRGAILAALASQAAAVEHLRDLIEGDTLPAAVGAPTFTPTGD